MLHCSKIGKIMIAAVTLLVSGLPSSASIIEWSGNSMQILRPGAVEWNWLTNSRSATPKRAAAAAVDIPTNLIVKEQGTTQQFADEVKKALTKVPRNVLVALANKGYKVVLSEKLTDAVPAAKNQQVRGYQEHATWDEVYGMFNRTTRRVVMAELAVTKNGGRTVLGPLRDTQRREGILRHECGHAVDQMLGNLSHKPEFVAAYEKGLKTISQYERKTLDYYLQPGDAGREETFAEIFAALEGDACDRNSDILLKNHFPELVALIRTKVQGIRG